MHTEGQSSKRMESIKHNTRRAWKCLMFVTGVLEIEEWDNQAWEEFVSCQLSQAGTTFARIFFSA